MIGEIQLGFLQGAAKKVAPQSFLPFSRQLFGVLSNFFFTNLYIDIILLSKCQVIYDSVEKQRNYGLLKK